MTDSDKIRAGKAAFADFLGQFGDQIDENQLIVLEVIFQEIFNETMAISSQAGQKRAEAAGSIQQHSGDSLN